MTAKPPTPAQRKMTCWILDTVLFILPMVSQSRSIILLSWSPPADASDQSTLLDIKTVVLDAESRGVPFAEEYEVL